MALSPNQFGHANKGWYDENGDLSSDEQTPVQHGRTYGFTATEDPNDPPHIADPNSVVNVRQRDDNKWYATAWHEGDYGGTPLFVRGSSRGYRTAFRAQVAAHALARVAENTNIPRSSRRGLSATKSAVNRKFDDAFRGPENRRPYLYVNE